METERLQEQRRSELASRLRDANVVVSEATRNLDSRSLEERRTALRPRPTMAPGAPVCSASSRWPGIKMLLALGREGAARHLAVRNAW